MTEPSDSRAVELSIEVPGTPEEVWDAIATGPGISSWFVPAEVEPRPGGTAWFDFGSMGKEETLVTAYEAPYRFAGESKTPRADGRVTAVEWLVEARDGGTCIVRLVNTGFGTDADSDAEFDGMENGWMIILRTLQLHMTHFRGEHARAIMPMVMTSGPNSLAWARVCRELGVATDLEAGGEFITEGAEPKLRGRVEHVRRSDAATAYTVLLDEPRGTALIAAEGDGESVMVSVWVYVYGDDADVVEKSLTDLVQGRLAARESSGAATEG